MQTSIRDAVNRLNGVLALADTIGESLDLAGSVNDASPPAWVHVYRSQIGAISSAAQVLEELLCRGFE